MKLQIINNDRLCSDIFSMTLNRGPMADAEPGQFVHIRCAESYDPLLRRPFSIAGMDEDTFKIIYKTAGKGTLLLSEKKPGETLDVLGPLGNGFFADAPPPKSAVIAAGGMGIAPMLFLLKKIPDRTVKFVLGARTRERLICTDELGESGVELVTATDDGTCGVKGDVCSVLARVFSEHPQSIVYACGPREMLHGVYHASTEYAIPSRLCFENQMACGVGACLGCVISTSENGRRNYKRVCKDGPVFNGEAIIW